MAKNIQVNIVEEKTKGGVKSRRLVAYIVLGITCFFCLIWFYVLLINATRYHGEIKSGFSALPSSYLFYNLKNALTGTKPILQGMINSVIISTCTAVLCVYFSAMTAYAIHAYNFRLKKLIFAFILAIMMIPTQVTALGFLQLVDNMKLNDSFIPLIVPSIASPVVFFYIKQYMESSLPHELLEAARIDGAGEIRIYNTIVLPLMVPAMAVQAIFSFVSSWNNYFIPALVLTKDDKKKTLPILIAELRNTDYANNDLGKVYATIAFSIFPVIVIYLILSKYIVGGLAAGSVKG
ncbi:MAG: carbohydrate ABC transporter permease [Lachnospiraceae bacterium]|nr:carbohydrate ABC transporter permease [Lachnospiraceae bacterium]